MVNSSQRSAASRAYSTSLRPETFGRSNMSWMVGRRRSASISSTRRRYDSLNVSARLVAVSVLPSLASVLVIMSTRVPCCDCA